MVIGKDWTAWHLSMESQSETDTVIGDYLKASVYHTERECRASKEISKDPRVTQGVGTSTTKCGICVEIDRNKRVPPMVILPGPKDSQ